MIAPIISIFLVVAGLIIAMLLAVSIIKNPPTSYDAVWLSESQFGEFEERLNNLREVIVIADTVDVPTRENFRGVLFALLDNFADGVCYTFIVPQEFYVQNHSDIEHRYESIKSLAHELSGANSSSDLFQMIPRDKSTSELDYPYVFYRYEDYNGKSEIVAFRGEDLGVGIAKNYRRLEPEVARSFLLSALSIIYAGNEVPDEKIVNYANFTPSEKVINFKDINVGERNEREKRIVQQ